MLAVISFGQDLGDIFSSFLWGWSFNVSFENFIVYLWLVKLKGRTRGKRGSICADSRLPLVSASPLGDTVYSSMLLHSGLHKF